MKNRIRKKVELIRQCAANPKDNLSMLDLKIHEMSPMGDYGMIDFPHELNDVNSSTDMQNNGGNDCDNEVPNDLDDLNSETAIEDLQNFGNDASYKVPNDTVLSQEEQNNNNKAPKNVAGGNRGRTLVVNTLQELEDYLNQPVIIEDVYSDEIVQTNIRDGSEELEDDINEPQNYDTIHRSISSFKNFRGNARGKNSKLSSHLQNFKQKSTPQSLKTVKLVEAAKQR